MVTKSADVNSENQIDGIELKRFTDLDMKSPKPGIYKYISFDAYIDTNALSSGQVRKAALSPLNYKRYLIEQENQKPSYPLEFGRAFARLCEDPNAIEKIIKAGPTKTPFTKAWMDEIEESPNTIFIKEDDIDMLKAMLKAFQNHPYAKVFSYDAHNELMLVWKCEHTGMICKGLIDIFKDANVIDIKTAADVRPHKFKWQIKDFRYDIQVCFYADGMRANGVRVDYCSNFFIEKEKTLPDVVVKGYNEEEMDTCRIEYIAAIKAIQEAEKTGIYPGIAPEPIIELYGFDEPAQTFE